MEGVWRWGEREIIYLSLHCHHQNDSCIKTGSNESHFNVSLIVRDNITRQCPQTTTFEVKLKGELKLIQTEVPLLTSLTPAHTLNEQWFWLWRGNLVLTGCKAPSCLSTVKI